MDMVSVAFFLTIALVTIFAATTIQTYRRLHHFKNVHWSVPFSRLWLLKTQSSGEVNYKFTEANDKYGSTVRIGPKLLMTCNANLVRQMNAVRSPFTRASWYQALKIHPERENIVSIRDEELHLSLRTKMAPGYSGKANPHLEDDVDHQLKRMIDLIDSKYLSLPEVGDFRTMDLARITSFFTLDVISKIAFGQPFDFLEKDEDPFGYLANLEVFLPAIIVFGVYTELTNIMKMPFMKAVLPKSTDKRGLGRVFGFAQKRVQERFGPKAVVRQDMLGSFIQHGLTGPELESETLTQITAGSDSTASALRLTLHHISTCPVVLSKLLTEARQALDAGQITRPVIREAEARRLPYLQACISEGLRISPPVSALMVKLTPKEGVMIDADGKEAFLPGGTEIAWNPWGMMRDETTFGADVNIFRPERWLAKDDNAQEQQRLKKMSDTVSLCFGYGRYGCLGQNIAMMELQKGVFEVLLHFNLQPCSLTRPFEEAMIGFTTHKNMDFVVTKALTNLSCE